MRIEGPLAGGISFDLGNSPREFTEARVKGKTIAMTTTNGTRALRACSPASAVLLGSFLNLRATAHLIESLAPADLLLVCSGTLDQVAYEDLLGAGALCDLVWPSYTGAAVADSAHFARRLYRLEQNGLLGAVSQSRNGRRLLAHPDLRADVPFCLQRDLFGLVAELAKDGAVRIRPPPPSRPRRSTRPLSLPRFSSPSSSDPPWSGRVPPRPCCWAIRTRWNASLPA